MSDNDDFRVPPDLTAQPFVSVAAPVQDGLSRRAQPRLAVQSPTSSTGDHSNLTKELTPHLGSNEVALGGDAIKYVLYEDLSTIPMKLNNERSCTKTSDAAKVSL